MGDAGARGVGDNWCTHRDMDSVQESSRCKQTKPSLWPTRPAGRIRDHSARYSGQGVLSPGLAWYAPRAIGSRTPRPRSLSEGPDQEGKRRSPGRDHPNRRQCPERGTHRSNRQHVGKDTPGTPTDRSRQYAIGSWQLAVLAHTTQYAVSEGGDTAHAHARNDTPPTQPHPVDDCNAPDTRANPPPDRHTPPRPAQPAVAAPVPAPARARRTDRTPAATAAAAAATAARHCRCDRAGTPAPSAPAPATHPDPRHTGHRRCQPEPRPTRRPGPATHPDPRHTRSRRCQPEPRLKPSRPGITSGDNSPPPSLPSAARPKTGPAPASDLGQPLASSSLTVAAQPKSASQTRSDSTRILRRTRFVAAGLKPNRRRRPGQAPADNLHRFVADRLKPIRRPAQAPHSPPLRR